jgi:CelD/BcsL family acetyltransferase involved in cellulose biosynthesis
VAASSAPAAAPLVEPVASFEAAPAGWDELAGAAANPFGTLAWTQTWWEHYGAGRRLGLAGVRDAGGRLAAVLPLYRDDRGPLRLLRFLGHGAADLHGPLCAPADLPLAAAALRDVAAGLGSAGVLLAERVDGAAALAPALGGRVLRREPSPVLAIEGSWEEWLEAKSANFRQQVRRMERRLAREHAVAFRLTTDAATLAADLETLFALHDARWAPEGGTGAFTPDRRAFHRAFAARALRRGWLRLWTAEVDGAPAAAWYGLRHAGREWYYQLGRDPRWDRHRVGFVLLVHTIREAFRDGMTAYHFGLGGEEYKDRFASDDPGVDTVAVGRPLPVRLAAGAARAARRLPDRPRRLVARRVRS